MHEGFDAVALGRALIHDRDLLQAFSSGRTAASGCTSCNRCGANVSVGSVGTRERRARPKWSTMIACRQPEVIQTESRRRR
jgi:hypothetical protein